MMAKCVPLSLILAMSTSAHTVSQIPRDTKIFLPLIAQAIEDEIYDLRREKLYFQVDGNGGGDSAPARISMYVSRNLSQNGTGVVIYKNMPYGEVYRYFTISSNKKVQLSGDPESKFPPTGGSMLTVYMSDDKVCNFIHDKAYLFKFTINPSVTPKRLNEAEYRQIDRIGYSFRLGKGPGYKTGF